MNFLIQHAVLQEESLSDKCGTFVKLIGRTCIFVAMVGLLLRRTKEKKAMQLEEVGPGKAYIF